MAVLLYLLVIPTLPFAQSAAQTAPGISIKYFGVIDENIYQGSKPHTDKDFEFLRAHHIKYILDVRFLPFLSGRERRKAGRYGIAFASLPMNASPIPPSSKHVDQILLMLRNKQFQPVYVHCVLGRDRTSLVSGLYKIYFLGVSPQMALREMKQSGFLSWWGVFGLKVYFDRHSTIPAALRTASRAPSP